MSPSSDASYDFRIATETLPPFWERRVIFIANILSLFFGNQEEIEELRREVGALETYGGRLIPILDRLCSRRGNLLVLEKKPDTTLLDYLESLGLSMPEICLLPQDFYKNFSKTPNDFNSFLEKLQTHPAEWLTGYVIDPTLVLLARRAKKKLLGSVEGCRRGNNKLLLHEFLTRQGLPVFDTEKAANARQVGEALMRLRQKGYRVAAIKAQIGASGIGLNKIDLSRPISSLSFPSYLFYEGPVLVQGWLDKKIPGATWVASPSTQLFITDGICWLYEITEQILSRASVHEGNIAPPPCFKRYPELRERLVEQTRQAGSWLAAQGYSGTASIDFHVVRRKGKLEVRICEINARVTGATYPAVLAKHLLPHHHWLMRNIRFSLPLKGAKILEMLRKRGVLFLAGKDEGVLPFNFNVRSDGLVVKGQFLFLAEKAHGISRLLKEVVRTFLRKGGYDRD